MKPTMALLFSLLLLSGFTSFPPASPPPTLDALFEATFPNATGVKWKKDGDLIYAFCTFGEMKVSVVYNLKGEMESCLRYYGAEQLPPHIRNRIHQRYPQTSITGVTEYYQVTSLTYTINLKQGNKLLRLQTDAFGNLLQKDSFNNGNL